LLHQTRQKCLTSIVPENLPATNLHILWAKKMPVSF